MASPDAVASRSLGARAWVRLVLVALGVIAVDQAIKALVIANVERGEHLNVFFFIDIVNVRNKGVAFGLFAGGGQVIVLIIALVALGALLWYFLRHPNKPLIWLPTGLLFGGAIANFIDRVRIGSVVDFIDFGWWPAFNLADTSIVIGVLILLYVLDGRPRRDRETTSEDD